MPDPFCLDNAFDQHHRLRKMWYMWERRKWSQVEVLWMNLSIEYFILSDLSAHGLFFRYAYSIRISTKKAEFWSLNYKRLFLTFLLQIQDDVRSKRHLWGEHFFFTEISWNSKVLGIIYKINLIQWTKIWSMESVHHQYEPKYSSPTDSRSHVTYK